MCKTTLKPAKCSIYNTFDQGMKQRKSNKAGTRHKAHNPRHARDGQVWWPLYTPKLCSRLWWFLIRLISLHSYLITPLMASPRGSLAPHACDKVEEEEENFITPVPRRNPKLRGDHGHGYARDGSPGSGHTYSSWPWPALALDVLFFLLQS